MKTRVFIVSLILLLVCFSSVVTYLMVDRGRLVCRDRVLTSVAVKLYALEKRKFRCVVKLPYGSYSCFLAKRDTKGNFVRVSYNETKWDLKGAEKKHFNKSDITFFVMNDHFSPLELFVEIDEQKDLENCWIVMTPTF